MTLGAANQTRFLQALGDTLEFPQRVRQCILTTDLVEATLADFTEVINRRLQTLEQGQNDFRADMVEGMTNINCLNERVDRMNRHMDSVNRRMNNGFGISYELKVGNNFGSIAGRYLGLRRIRILKAALVPIDGNLNDLIAEAEDRGAISAGQAHELLAADLIAFGRSRDNGHEAYVAAEASITLSDQDIVRASERAQYLAKATGQVAVGAVIGESVGSEQVELARQRNVTVMLLPAA